MISVRQNSISLLTLAALAAGCSAGPSPASATEESYPLAAAAHAPSHASSMATTLMPRSQEAWRKAMSKTPLPKEGCFQAAHPSTSWVEVPCTTAPEIPYAPAKVGAHGAQTIGGGNEFSSEVSGTISWAEGSFPTVIGVTSATDGSANNFSLQLNSNFFSGSPMCKGAKTPASCLGWQQFVYAPDAAFMQYWLINYGNTCPSGWNTYGSDCWQNSIRGAQVPAIAITDLANLTITGTAGSFDTMMLATGAGVIYATSQTSVVGLNAGWKAAEFNIFGNGGGSEVNFNSGASIYVQILTDSVVATTASATCESAGYTAETNNLNLVANSCCPFGGTTPGILFMESNVSGATAEACPTSAVGVGAPDLLWQNTTTGAISAWDLQDGTVTGTQQLSWECGSSNGCSSQWHAIDTLSNSILWNNPTTGSIQEWTFDINGGVSTDPALSWTCSAAAGCSEAWHPIGRVTEGGQAGLLWYDSSTGSLSIWDLSGSNVTGTQTLSWTCGGTCAQSWRPILTTDINNDGNTDVLWYDQTSGVVSAWLLNGSTVTGTQNLSWTCTAASGCAAAWSIIGAADVNGDGHTDITWFDPTTGQVSSWLLNGSGTVTGTQALSWTCTTASGCATAWHPLGYASLP